MNDALEKLRNPQVITSMLGAISFENAMELLSRREEPRFESAWLAAFDRLSTVTPTDDERLAIEQIREGVFKVVFRATGDDDLAAYTSDDFDLIGRAIAGHATEPFVSALWMAYASGHFPPHEAIGDERDLSLLVLDTLQSRSS